MSTEVLSYEVRGRVAWLTLDDGGPNALRTDVFDAFFAALDAAEEDPEVGSLVIAGRPGFFSAGMDLKWMEQVDRDELGTIGPNMARLAHRIFIFPKPVIAAVEGHAIAGGAVILLACDRSVGAFGEYKVGLNEVAIGIPFGGFAMKLAQSHLAPAAFGGGLLYGEVFRPEQAHALGYLDELAEPAMLAERVTEIAERAAGLNSFAYVGTKYALRGELAEEILEQAESGALVPLFQAFADLREAQSN
ncbi:MAG: crotonase/enoyl-CoA hydratase family protein [Solirubrobacterales bacterium]